MSMVIVPNVRSTGEPRRVIAQRCAPSIGIGNFTVIPALGDAIHRGYTIVAPAVVRDFARRACALNKTINYKSIPGGEHATVARMEGKVTLQWIDDRFAGIRASNNCHSI